MSDFVLFTTSWWQAWVVGGLVFQFSSVVLALATIGLGIWTGRKSGQLRDMENRHKTQLAKLKGDVEHLTKVNLRETSNVNPESDRQLIASAKTSVQLLGINSLGILHHCQEALIKFLTEKSGRLEVLLLDPNSQSFSARVAFEEDKVGRIASEWVAAIKILMAIQRRTENGGAIELRIRDEKPDRSLAVIDGIGELGDGSFMLINYYPETRGRRGYSGSQFLAEHSLARDFDSYDTNARLFSDLWQSAKSISLENAAHMGSAINMGSMARRDVD